MKDIQQIKGITNQINKFDKSTSLPKNLKEKVIINEIFNKFKVMNEINCFVCSDEKQIIFKRKTENHNNDIYGASGILANDKVTTVVLRII